MLSKENHLFAVIEAYEKASKAIIITGTGRSGTSIVGQLIHSMCNVEYIFEPQLLISLSCLIHTLAEKDWKLLYETYLYEDFLVNALAARNLNFNKNDDSYIFYVKSFDEINERLLRINRKYLTRDLAAKAVIAYKMLDNIDEIRKIKKYYPLTKVVVMLRCPEDTINSILQKKWFNGINIVYPYKKHINQTIPFFVNAEDEAYWLTLNEIDKAAYYYIKINEQQKNLPDGIFIKYNDLIKNPNLVADELTDKLNLSYGILTKDVINKIKPMTNYNNNLGLIKKISSDLRLKLNEFQE